MWQRIFLNPVVLGLISLPFYLYELDAVDLGTDEAKDALNVGYPHPPLARGVIKAFTLLLGKDEWVARLPVAFAGAVSVGIVFLILQRVLADKRRAAAGALLFALSPLHIEWARTAYLSPALETFWLLALCGIVLIESAPRKIIGHLLLLGGFTLASWTELQSILFVPLLLWCYWKVRGALKDERILGTLAILALLQPVLVGVYTLFQNDTLADIRGILNAASATYSFQWLWQQPIGLYSLVALGIALFYILVQKRVAIPLAPYLVLLTAAVLAFFFFVRHAEYYAPYLAASAGLLGIILILRSEKYWIHLFVAAAIIFALFIPQTYRVPPELRFFHENAAKINDITKGEKYIGVLGPYGYQVKWYLHPEPVGFSPEFDPSFWIVFAPSRLTPIEKKFLGTLMPVESWGTTALYKKRVP